MGLEPCRRRGQRSRVDDARSDRDKIPGSRKKGAASHAAPLPTGLPAAGADLPVAVNGGGEALMGPGMSIHGDHGVRNRAPCLERM